MVDEPQGFRSSTPPVVASTGPLAVARFHGHNAETYEKPNLSVAERFRYLYTEEELKDWVASIRGLAEQADRVHVLMNNCYGVTVCATRSSWQSCWRQRDQHRSPDLHQTLQNP